MPTTRRQTAIEEGKIKPTEQVKTKRKRSASSTRTGDSHPRSQKKVEKSRVADDVKEDTQQDKVNLEPTRKQLDGEDAPASKKLKMEEETEGNKSFYKVGEYRNIGWCAYC